MSFDNFDTIKQGAENSCGAFALAAALCNFVLVPQTQQALLLNTANLATGYNQPGHAVSNTGSPTAFAESIYVITGNLSFGIGVANYQYSELVSNINPPSALVYIATLFGFAPNRIAVRYTNAGMEMFQALAVTNTGTGGSLLNTEIGLLNGINNNQGMIIAGPMDYENVPTAMQVQLILVNRGRHWLAINSTQLYDPGNGYVGPYVLADEGAGQLSWNYKVGEETHENGFSGIWIELRANH